MYGWLWRRLPGGFGSKLASAAMLAAAAVALLWFVIFPWITPRVPLDRVMPSGGSASCHSASQHTGGAAARRAC